MNTVSTPALLVSVRDAIEAGAALEGGCDILDVKDPARGSLGMADVAQLQSIITVADSFAAPLTEPRSKAQYSVSAALGEALDWIDAKNIPVIPLGLAYVKLGTAGSGDGPGWSRRWQSIADRFNTGHARLIIVANADWHPAEGPSPAAVMDAAAELGCAGVLIDTHRKDGRSLFDWMTVRELQDLAAGARQSRLEFALAGSLALADIPRLLDVRPDIVGIRTAACRDGKRNSPIDATAVRSFRDALRSLD